MICSGEWIISVMLMYNKYDDQLWDMHISLLQGATLILLFCCLLTPKSWYKIPAFGIKINDQQTDILYEQIFGIFLEFLEKVKCTTLQPYSTDNVSFLYSFIQ